MKIDQHAPSLPFHLSAGGSAKLLYIRCAQYNATWHSTPHSHSYVELFYITGGSGQFRIEDTSFPVSTNQLILINPNTPHTELSYDSRPLEYIVLGIEGLELVFPEVSRGFQVLDCRSNGEILPCLRHILRETEQRQTGYETICRAYMEILLVLLMRGTSIAFSGDSIVPLVSRQCAIIRRYIDSHYKEALTLDLLADIAHVNKFYMAHAFKEEYGVSPINYLIRRRIEESCYLLRETDMSLSQIARILGFSSASYFSQSFRRVQGTSPIEYRKDIRIGNTSQ